MELNEVESLIADRRLDAAEAELRAILASTPEDAESRMLLGICGQMKGDAACFCRVYRELAPGFDARIRAGEDSPVVARWRNYLRVASYLVALGVITLTGSGLAAPTSGLFETNAAPQSAEAAPAVKRPTVEQLRTLSRGVHSIRHENVVISRVVVGTCAVPKALRGDPDRAARYGGSRARAQAQRELTRFLSTECTCSRTAGGEMVVEVESDSAIDLHGAETSSRARVFAGTKMDEEEIDEYVSGIQAIWEGLNDSGEYVWVGAWNAKVVRARPRPMTRYNMGGRPMTKYNMGGYYDF